MRYKYDIYNNLAEAFLNILFFPLKQIIPQPIINFIPLLLTNQEVRLRKVSNFIKGQLLDIGCGPNLLTKLYRTTGGKGVGVDVYPWAGVDQLVEDSSHLPYKDNSFDTISFVACLNHIPSRTKTLKEANRLLRNDGIVIITNINPFLSLIWHKYAFWDRDYHERGLAEGEVYGFLEKELIAMLEEADFKLLHKEHYNWCTNKLYVFGKKRD